MGVNYVPLGSKKEQLKLFVDVKCLLQIDHIRTLSIALELACNGGSCGGISLKIFACKKIAPYEPRLQDSSSSIPRI